MPYEPFEYEQERQADRLRHRPGARSPKDLDADPDVIDVDFDDISRATRSTRRLRLAISAMTITGDRARVLDFSSPYFDADQALIIAARLGLDQLDGPARQAGRRPGGHHR